MLNIETIADLPTSAKSGAVVLVNRYHQDTTGGGGTFYWQADGTKIDHNGGTIIDPTHSVAPTDTGYYEGEDASADGVWVRRYDGAINIKWFGIDDRSTTQRLQEVLSRLQAIDASVIEFTGINSLQLTDGLILENFSNSIFDFGFCSLEGIYVKDSFSIEQDFVSELDRGQRSKALSDRFQDNDHVLGEQAEVTVEEAASRWMIVDGDTNYAVRRENGTLVVEVMDFSRFSNAMRALLLARNSKGLVIKNLNLVGNSQRCGGKFPTNPSKRKWVVGLCISDGCSEVKLDNVCAEDFPASGILVFSNNAKNITVRDSSIKNSGVTGGCEKWQDVAGVPENISYIHCKGLNNEFGCQFAGVKNGVIDNCYFEARNPTWGSAGSFGVADMARDTDVAVTNSVFRNLDSSNARCTSITSHARSGPLQGTLKQLDVRFVNCCFIASASASIWLEAPSRASFTNCQFVNGPVVIIGPKTEGLPELIPTELVSFLNCVVNGGAKADIGYHLFRPAIIQGGQIRDIAPPGGSTTSSACIRLEPGSEGSKILNTVIGSFQGETGQSGIRNNVAVSDITVRDVSFRVAIPLNNTAATRTGWRISGSFPAHSTA